MWIRGAQSKLTNAVISVGLIALVAVEAEAAENPITWSLEAASYKPIRAGSRFTSRLVARLRAGWHLYGLEELDGGPIATEISLSEGSIFNLESVRGPKPITLLDPNFGKRVRLYVDKAEFLVTVIISETVPRGQHRLEFEVRYQCCNQSICLPPKRTLVQSEITVR
jgi:DsbC/DsbD-like thiol-disulfide interchange protein